MDSIGRISVPDPPQFSGPTFPLVSHYPVVMTRPYELISHRFGGGATLSVQDFAIGFQARRFQVQGQAVSLTQRTALLAFYNAVQGSYQSFSYPVPNADQTTTAYRVTFDTPPLSITDLTTMCRTGFTLVEDITTAQEGPYSLSGIPLLRFPNTALSAALLSQVQRIIPLIRIRVRNLSVPDIYLSDRRVIVNNQLYLPRLLNMGEPGTDVVMSQSLSGAADNVQFTFGNADRTMSKLAIDCGLQFAVIDLSLYHVQTGILLQLWKGIILSHTRDGSAQFHVTCSDGLYPVTQNYPRRTITRQCWKTFNDGLNCPWATTPGATGNPSSCDYFFNSPNGCLSHGMSPYFGGHFSVPQGVLIHDEGTAHLSIDWSPWMLLSPAFGGLQIARNRVTATSIVADNIWGKPLAEIYCNDDGDPRHALWANAAVIATRDESTFQDMLGLVGVGPIGFEGMSVQTNSDGFKFLVTPLADGFPPQGFKVDSNLNIKGYHPELGLREVAGTDPADPTTDQFALGQGTPQRWDVPDPTFSNILTHQPHDILPYAAGTAFIEMRYSKDPGKGITPTTPGAHSMTVPIAQGLTGWRFDSAGNRTAEAGLTNPFWIAVNTYLRALGLDKASAATQLKAFDLASVSNFDSVSGAAQIADLRVQPIVGDQSTVETQFRFQGTIADFKPFRDWLTQILNCSLGFYTFEYGRLKLGCRENARATTGFTVGNMLYQSLSITPVPLGGEFEYLKISFANRDLQYQQDTAEYQDKDHAAYYSRPGAPLTAPMNSPGLASLSQGLRVAATRVREEIGGVLRPDHSANPYIEWDNNDLVTLRTTILALDTEVGDVVSITHPDIPSYPGPVSGSAGGAGYIPQPPNTWNYRIQRWTLHKDWSITIQARSVTDSMYDLAIGPKPADQLPPTQPPLLYAIPHGPMWAPHQVQATAIDALFPSEWSFDTDEEYITLADGSASAVVNVTGVLPVNTFAPATGTPSIGSIAQSSVGGFIPSGTTLRVCVISYDATGVPSPPSQIALVQTPGPGGSTWDGALEAWTDASDAWGVRTNSITLAGINWPAGGVSYGVFASSRDDLICLQQTGGLPLPSSIILAGPLSRSTYSLPSPFIAKVRIKAKLIVNGGVAGVAVQSVGVNTLVCAELIDTTVSPIDWTGRVVSIYGRTPGSTPFTSFKVTAFDPATGTFTLDRDPTGIVLAGDALVVRVKPDAPNAAPYTSIADTGLANVTNAYTGLSLDLTGNVIRVLAGTSRGKKATITANTLTSLTWDQPISMDDTTVFIVEEPGWRYTVDSTTIASSDPDSTVTLQLPVDNFAGKSLLLAGFTVDVDGSESPDGDQPMREEFIFGAPGAGSLINPGYYTITPVMGNAAIDLANGLNQRLVLSGAAVTFLAPIWTGGSINAGVAITLYIDQDATGGRATPIFTGSAGGFGSDTASEEVAPDANTRTSATFRYHGTIWIRDNWKTGLSPT
jgi:hypothetical protein